MNQHSTTKLNIPMCAACILLCLTLLSIHWCGGLYARYTATDSASDSARVAKFDISEGFIGELDITPGGDEIEFQLINKGEVAVSYTVTVSNTTRNIPYKFEMGGVEALYEGTVSGELAPDSTETITIGVILDEAGALDYMGMVDLIKVVVNAQQID